MAAFAACLSDLDWVEGEVTADVLACEELRELGREWTDGAEVCACDGLMAAIMLVPENETEG